MCVVCVLLMLCLCVLFLLLFCFCFAGVFCFGLHEKKTLSQNDYGYSVLVKAEI